MESLEGSFAALMFVVIALPGLAYAAVRRWARGEAAADRDFGLSVARGAVFAVVLTCTYVIVWGDVSWTGLGPGGAADTFIVRDGRSAALAVLGFYVALPSLMAILINRRHLAWAPVRGIGWLRVLRSRHGYTDTPTAWDHAGRRHQAAWVKIKKPSGEWVGGWFTEGSFISTYPESRSIYIDQQCSMSGDGNFLELIPGASVFITVSDDDVVVWVSHSR